MVWISKLQPFSIWNHVQVSNIHALTVKNPPATQEKQETRVRSLCLEAPLQEGIATRYSILARKIPWTGEPEAKVHVLKELDTTEAAEHVHMHRGKKQEEHFWGSPSFTSHRYLSSPSAPSKLLWASACKWHGDIARLYGGAHANKCLRLPVLWSFALSGLIKFLEIALTMCQWVIHFEDFLKSCHLLTYLL